jgi:hypothetical protein
MYLRDSGSMNVRIASWRTIPTTYDIARKANIENQWNFELNERISVRRSSADGDITTITIAPDMKNVRSLMMKAVYSLPAARSIESMISDIEEPPNLFIYYIGLTAAS